MKVIDHLGVQSFCFRGFPKHEDVIARLKECGLNKIELAKKHVDYEDEACFEDTIKIYQDTGVEIVSIGVIRMAANREAEEKAFKFAQMAGAKFMACDFDLRATPECYRVAEELAETYDVRLAIHNHGGRHWLGTDTMWSYVFDNTTDCIGLCLDTAWAIDSRLDPVQMVKKFGDRLYGMHIKDFVYKPDRTPEDVVVGTGILDLPGLFKAMNEVNFAGYVVLEYEADVDNPVPALVKCVDAVREADHG